AMEDQKKSTFKKRLYYPFFKRSADIFCSLVLLIIFCVLFPFIAIAIKLDSPGPIFFSQLRVGQRGHLFRIYKLRTMRKDAEALVDKAVFRNKKNPFIQQEHDPRVTRVGHFLRKSSIDELPQLFCVLQGNMSFIGPRPLIPEEIHVLKEEYLYRLAVKPGLTGLAQVSGRGALDLRHKMEKDLEYIDTMSAWLDIKILWRTVIAVLRHKGAS
ncbi:MAG: sugar transferase, partial [Christensenellaceae bacterium]|nr:sugar transferase [Christensenellaceae bacterium]